MLLKAPILIAGGIDNNVVLDSFQDTTLHVIFSRNGFKMCIRDSLNTYYSGLKREQQLYRYLLGNGATRTEAQAPFIRQAIIKAFSPLIANISVMGLVAFPGTMIGQILGGSSPNVAIKYQMMIMVITFTAVSYTHLYVTYLMAYYSHYFIIRHNIH